MNYENAKSDIKNIELLKSRRIFEKRFPLKFVEKSLGTNSWSSIKIKSGTNVLMYTADYTNSLLPSRTVRIIGVTL